MEARAYLKYARIAPRKVQIVLDLIRGKEFLHLKRRELLLSLMMADLL